MTTLTPDQLSTLRQAVEPVPGRGYTKPEINKALQAVEDYFTSNTSGVYAAVDKALPGLSDEQKVAIVKYSLHQKFGSM